MYFEGFLEYSSHPVLVYLFEAYFFIEEVMFRGDLVGLIVLLSEQI